MKVKNLKIAFSHYWPVLALMLSGILTLVYSNWIYSGIALVFFGLVYLPVMKLIWIVKRMFILALLALLFNCSGKMVKSKYGRVYPKQKIEISRQLEK